MSFRPAANEKGWLSPSLAGRRVSLHLDPFSRMTDTFVSWLRLVFCLHATPARHRRAGPGYGPTRRTARARILDSGRTKDCATSCAVHPRTGPRLHSPSSDGGRFQAIHPPPRRQAEGGRNRDPQQGERRRIRGGGRESSLCRNNGGRFDAGSVSRAFPASSPACRAGVGGELLPLYMKQSMFPFVSSTRCSVPRPRTWFASHI